MFKWKKSSAAEVDLAVFAQKLLHYRQLRSEFFEAEAISAGGWDMLLHLYSAPADAAPVSIGSAAQALGIPSGDALSTAERLCHYRLAAQGDSAGGWESIPLWLMPEGREALEQYLRHFLTAGDGGPAAV